MKLLLIALLLLGQSEFKSKKKSPALEPENVLQQPECDCAAKEAEIAKLKTEIATLADQRAADERHYQQELQQVRSAANFASANQPTLIDIIGLASTGVDKTESRVQWLVTTSPSCGPCHGFVNRIKVYLKNFRIGGEENAQIRIVSISDADWTRLGYTLPRAELLVDNHVVYTSPIVDAGGNIIEQVTVERMATMFNQYASQQAANPMVAGMKVGTLGIKPQVQNLLNALTPFLDGGTLTMTYNPKPGVVKEYLTINQGSVGVRIPAKTVFTLGMNNETAYIKFQQPTVQVRIPVRGNTDVKSITLTPDKLAVQLSYMIDPEWILTDGPNVKQADNWQMLSGEAAKPPMEIDEEVTDEDNNPPDGTFGEPRSGHWPTVRAAYNKLHPVCEACGSPDNGNVHHVTPFHIDPRLECDMSNLIRLCRDDHFVLGHTRNWKNSNPNVRKDAASKLREVKKITASKWLDELNPFLKQPNVSATRVKFVQAP